MKIQSELIGNYKKYKIKSLYDNIIGDLGSQVERGFADTNYRMATDTCAINTNASNNTRDIIDNQNANTRAILETIQQGKIDAMQDKIAALTAQNTQLSFAASQAAQNTYLVDQLRPCPVPAYITCNPWGNTAPYGTCGNCGCN